MIASSSYGTHAGEYCPYCGNWVGTGDNCCRTTLSVSIRGYGIVYRSVYDDVSYYTYGRVFEEVPWKRRFWEYLKEAFPTTLNFKKEKVLTFTRTTKQYNRRMLFANSGYLPRRIREIRK